MSDSGDGGGHNAPPRTDNAPRYPEPGDDPTPPRRASGGVGAGAAGLRRTVRSVLPRLGRSVVVAFLTCLPVAVLAILVKSQAGPLIRTDEAAVVAATGVTRQHPDLRTALIVWQEIFQPWHVYLAALPLVVFTYVQGMRAHAVWGTVTMLVGWNLGLDAKLLVQRARPIVSDPVSEAPGFSFPSGHAFNTAVMVLTCLVMIWPRLSQASAPVRIAVLGGGAVVIAITAANRVMLGVHYPSDVTAGVLLAAGLVAASWIGFRRTPDSAKNQGDHA